MSRRLTWVLAVDMLTCSRAAISVLDRPSPIRVRTSRSRSVTSASLAAARRPPPDPVRTGAAGELRDEPAGDARGEQRVAGGDLETRPGPRPGAELPAVHADPLPHPRDAVARPSPLR